VRLRVSWFSGGIGILEGDGWMVWEFGSGQCLVGGSLGMEICDVRWLCEGD
jgi:hypothetical protein